MLTFTGLLGTLLLATTSASPAAPSGDFLPIKQGPEYYLAPAPDSLGTSRQDAIHWCTYNVLLDG